MTEKIQSLLEEVQGYFTTPVVSQASATVGENEANVRKALPKIIPVVLSGFIKLSEQVGGADVLWTMTRDAYENGAEALSAEKLTARARRGQELVQALLADSYQRRVSIIADESSIRSEAVEGLLGLAVPVMLWQIGQYAAERQFDPGKLGQWLQLQRSSISGLLLADAPPAVPVSAPAAAGRPAMARPLAAAPVAAAPAPRAVPQLWLWPALVVLAAVVIGFWLGQQRNPATGADLTSDAVTAAAPPPGAEAGENAAYAATVAARAAEPATATPGGRYDAATQNYIYDTGRPVRIMLADGTTQTVGANSTENNLYNFLSDNAVQVDSVNRTKGWINFDRIYFDPKKATLTDESVLQLRNVAVILKNFPAARIKIGGYTDSTGAFMDNLKLSEARATAAMAALVDMGIAANRVEAKGYGQKHNLASNETPVGRSLNRRISLRVTRK